MKSHYHCVYKLTYHLVLVTKYRRKCFTNEMLNRLEEIVRKNCQDWEIDLLEFNGEADHIHLLLEMHPNIMPSKFINNIKTVSSRLIRKEFDAELKQYYWKPVLWTRAYCLLTTGGATIDVIREYIKNQERPE
ncbi:MULTISPECIES: IS200/IS605 family transposase [Acinetobacter]|jgi:putative transposase|uniref:IS200/IS605 family transposase n=1 Tax=Acinetobacter TaxID=469 RepID=UPI000BDCF8CE|nr:MULTISPECIES: IS200/IS605 family transposase [Acinetobacter]MBT0886116.1 IS200/IS605 family transposase [Acinetobacter towneri]MDV2484737.1 IS200/IS605 family transposase [Acinetobacter towneri]NWJ91523.1 IS200/IS605 family transposase [Acinetobacter sp. Swhac1]PCN61640.1 IS200/IS605 family transposase [Acinetobacter sp. YT-02]UIZ58653.1 IS200/IS605 family transposase [Acinetobacter sp. SCLZS86]